MDVLIDTRSLESYRQFLAIKRLPICKFTGHVATFPDEYAEAVGVKVKKRKPVKVSLSPHLFDYQADISRLVIAKQKFGLYADCGSGKTMIYFELAKHVIANESGGVLIVAPLMVCHQIVEECQKFYPELPIELLDSGTSNLNTWLKMSEGKIGVVNFEAMKPEVERGNLSCLIVDEASILKSHFGKFGQQIIRLGKGMKWKLTGTGTPAPNDRIEYANQAVFLDQFPTVNSFLARYFVNRGNTGERWELRPHAVEAFYRSLSHWSIFLSNPATYGWKDNCETLPPIHVHIHDVGMTESQNAAVRRATGGLFAVSAGGVTQRSQFSKIAKGIDGSSVTLKYDFIRDLVATWSDAESTIIWCWFNEEQSILERLFPDAASVKGETKHEKRIELIKEFQSGKRRILISKPKVLGFGLNLQAATRQVFSSLIDSYEQYYQAVKRSNRYGSTRPLNVHLPVLDVERPMVENVLRKAKNVQSDTEEQERIFKRYGWDLIKKGIACHS